MSEWQPIETAPFDGTSILIHGKTRQGWRVMAAHFSKEFGGHWIVACASGSSCGIEHVCSAKAASHWMPLPKPPREPKE